MQTTHVLIAPVSTEKSVGMPGKYTFEVHPDATKADVKKAIQEFYGVEPEKVNIIKLPPKERIIGRGRVIQKRKTTKKAIVSLEAGATLDFNAFK